MVLNLIRTILAGRRVRNVRKHAKAILRSLESQIVFKEGTFDGHDELLSRKLDAARFLAEE